MNDKLMFWRQKPVSVMVWAGATSTEGKTPLIFIEEGVKMNQHVYLDLLRNKLIPWINATFGESGVILQQDGVTSHTANRVQEWCKRNMTGFLVEGIMASLISRTEPHEFCDLEYSGE